MTRRRRIDPTHPSVVDLTPDTVPVDGIPTPVTFTYGLGSYAARLTLPNGRLVTVVARTRAEALAGVYWDANFNHLTDNNN